MTDEIKLNTDEINWPSKIDGLTSMNSLVVSNGLLSGLRIVTVPMYGLRVHQLGPGPFLRLSFSTNLFKETEFLKANLRAPSTCRERRSKYIYKWTGMKGITTQENP